MHLFRQIPFPIPARLGLCLLLLLSSCSLPVPPANNSNPTPAPVTETMVRFFVTLPAELRSGESVVLAVLDEVTGLAFNQTLYPLQADDALHYAINLPFRIGSVIKYRYIRQGDYTVQEHLPGGEPVRYRLHHVTSQALVADQVSRWTDTTYTGSIGRIMGTVRDTQNGQPIAGLLVSAAGLQTITGADGAYLLEGLPPGTHNLVVYAQNGAYQTFEQGAAIAADASTPADVALMPAPLVDVTFTINLPPGTSSIAQVRIAGDLSQLGNTFADLAGGISTLADRMPLMSTLPDGRRSLTLALPVGADLRYKYTLGDGVWNAEYDTEGKIRLRQLMVPATSVTIEETVTAWTAPGPAAITFRVTPPKVMPSGENISIQFNPGYGWLEPLPMWPGTDHEWNFTLYSPLQGMDSLQYRYCRNEQCGSADDASTAGLLASGRTATLSTQTQIFTDTIQEWNWLTTLSGPTTVPSVSISKRPEGFLAGVELQASYHPSWTPHFAQTAAYVNEMNANWLIFSPTWSYSPGGSPLLRHDLKQDMSWQDLLLDAQLTRQMGLNVGLFPQVNFPNDAETWWSEAQCDYPWWVSWFDRYRAFALNHARLANSSGAGVLILGGEELLPAIPGNTLSDAKPTNLPLDAEKWWRALFAELRSIYPGPIAWAVPYPQGFENLPPFLDTVDFVYIEWSAPLAVAGSINETDLAVRAGELLDSSILPLQLQTIKPVVLALNYPSADGSLTGCLLVQEGRCLHPNLLARPNPDYPQIALSLDQQTTAYNAMLLAVNERPWIGGIISQGFYPPAMLQDKSASIYGKPTAGALWYWYARFLGK